MRTLKVLLLLLVGLPLVAAVALVVFVLTLNPNRLKPIVQDAASDQGLALDLAGDIKWRFYPNLGLSIAGVKVRNAEQGAELAIIEQAAFSVALKPLLARSIEVVGISLEGATFNYLLDDKGASQWPAQKPSKAEPKVAVNTAAAEGPVPTLHISRVLLDKVTLNYRDTVGTQISISDLHIDAQGVNLEGKAFDLNVYSRVNYAPYPVMVVKFDGAIALGLDVKTLDLPRAVLTLTLPNGAQASSQLTSQAHWGEPLGVSASIDATVDNLKDLMTGLGVALPAARNPDVFKALRFKAQLSYAPDALTLKDTRIQLDNTNIQLSLGVTQLAKPRIKAQIDVDSFNVDDYLAPAPTTPAASAPLPAPVPLPYDALRALDLAVTLKVGKLTASGVALTDFNSTLKARDGVIALKPVGLNVAGGAVSAEAVLDARKKTATLDGQLNTTAVQLEQLMQQLKQPESLQGALNSHITFTSSGQTDQELSNNLKAKITAESASIKLTTLNIEQQFCEAIGMLKGGFIAPEPSTTAWASYSELAPLNLDADYANKKIILQSLSADLQRLHASSYGEVDLVSGDFKFPLDVKLAEFASGLEGCVSVDEKWRNRTVPLRCKGNLAAIGAKTCLPDGPRITEAIKDKAKEQVKETVDKAKNKIGDKAEEEAKKLLEKHVDKEDTEKLKNTLKGLFNR